jgi:hypothetical protein
MDRIPSSILVHFAQVFHEPCLYLVSCTIQIKELNKCALLSKHSIYLPVKLKSVSVSKARKSSTSVLLSLSSCTSDSIAEIPFFERSMLVICVLLTPKEGNDVLDHDASESVYLFLALVLGVLPSAENIDRMQRAIYLLRG